MQSGLVQNIILGALVYFGLGYVSLGTGIHLFGSEKPLLDPESIRILISLFVAIFPAMKPLIEKLKPWFNSIPILGALWSFPSDVIARLDRIEKLVTPKDDPKKDAQ